MNANALDPNSDEATAYHEAGHAVVALVLGRPVEKVTIRENTLRLGQVQIQRWLDKAEYLLDDEPTWRAITEVARELLEKKSLSGRAVAQILEICTRDSI